MSVSLFASGLKALAKILVASPMLKEFALFVLPFDPGPDCPEAPGRHRVAVAMLEYRYTNNRSRQIIDTRATVRVCE